MVAEVPLLVYRKGDFFQYITLLSALLFIAFRKVQGHDGK